MAPAEPALGAAKFAAVVDCQAAFKALFDTPKHPLGQ